MVAIPSGAASTPTPKFCAAYQKISGASDQPTPKQAKALGAKFKAAGKQAPAKVKSAANTIVGVLNKLGDISASNAADLGKFYTSADFRKYGQAVGTFFKYRVRVRHHQLTSHEGPDMTRLRILLVAALALATFGVLAGPAVASVSTARLELLLQADQGDLGPARERRDQHLQVRRGLVQEVRQRVAFVGEARTGEGQEGGEHPGVVLRGPGWR